MGPYRAPAMNLRRCPAKRGRWDLSHLLVLARDPRQRPGLASVPCARGAFAVAGLCDQQRFSLVADPLKACAGRSYDHVTIFLRVPVFLGPVGPPFEGLAVRADDFSQPSPLVHLKGHSGENGQAWPEDACRRVCEMQRSLLRPYRAPP